MKIRYKKYRINRYIYIYTKKYLNYPATSSLLRIFPIIMSSPPQSKLSVPTKKDSTVAIVIGQQRRVSDTKGRINSPDPISKPVEPCKHIESCVDNSDKKQSSIDRVTHSMEVMRNDHNKKKFLINDILQQKTLQEQAIPASQNRLQLLSLFTRGMVKTLNII